MNRIPQTRQELIKHLQENLEFLRASCNSFDGGFYAEAKRLATTIRVLSHDTPNSKSILGQLGIKSSIKFVNTASEYNPSNLMPHIGLVVLSLTDKGVSYEAPLFDLPQKELSQPKIDFDQWWEQKVIDDKQGGGI